MSASVKAWVFLRVFRILIFSLCAILSLVLAITFSVFLARESSYYDSAQRAIVVILVVLDGVSAILLYLMFGIVVKFRIWPDASRTAFLLLSHGGSAAVYALFNKKFPCNNFGPVNMCRLIQFVIEIALFSLTGLLLIYAAVLSIMTCIPRPPPPPNPESAITVQDQMKPGNSKRASVVSSADSQTGLLDGEKTLYTPESRGPTTPFSVRPPQPQHAPVRQRNGGYGTVAPPGPMYSNGRPSAAQNYSSRTPQTPYSDRSLNRPGDLRVPSPLQPSRQFPPRTLQNLPESLPRGQPAGSHVSPQSPALTDRAPEYGIAPQRPIVRQAERDLQLTFGGSPANVPASLRPQRPSPQVRVPNPYVDVNVSLIATSGYPSLPVTPNTSFTMRSPVRAHVPSRQRAASPGQHSIHSVAGSLHMHDRSMNASAPPLPSSGGYNTAGQYAVPSRPAVALYEQRQGAPGMQAFGYAPNGLNQGYSGTGPASNTAINYGQRY